MHPAADPSNGTDHGGSLARGLANGLDGVRHALGGRQAWEAVGLLLALAVVSSAAGQSAERARSADTFVDSLGVCTHWDYPDTPYGGAYEDVKRRLLESGIRHQRTSFNDRNVDLGHAGVRTTLLVNADQGTPTELCERIKALNAAGARIDAVEGPNEPDFFWISRHTTYQDKGFPEGVLAFQQDLYAALKKDPATASLPVIGPALGKTYNPGEGFPNPFVKGSFTAAVDWGNFHPYPGGNPFSVPFPYAGIEKYYWHGNFPSGSLDEFPAAFDTYRPPFDPKPMAATETGYATDRPSGTSEAAQAKYLPRLYAEYFRLGIVRTCTYEFVDEFTNPADREANFGLLHHDLSPKPAFGALKNLIALLGEPDVPPGFKPGDLNYRLEIGPAPGGYDRTQAVHHLLLQKSDGTFYLTLWHEIANEDASSTPHRQLRPPPMPTVVTLRPSEFARAEFFQPNAGSAAVRSEDQPERIRLEVPDELVVIKLIPAAKH